MIFISGDESNIQEMWVLKKLRVIAYNHDKIQSLSYFSLALKYPTTPPQLTFITTLQQQQEKQTNNSTFSFSCI